MRTCIKISDNIQWGFRNSKKSDEKNQVTSECNIINIFLSSCCVIDVCLKNFKFRSLEKNLRSDFYWLKNLIVTIWFIIDYLRTDV